jgi:hypothetical protein
VKERRVSAYIPKLFGGACAAPIPIGTHRVAAVAQHDNGATFVTVCRGVLRWVLQYLEVVFICAVVYIYLRIKGLLAGLTLLPGPGMSFVIVGGTQGIAVMIAKTAVAGV